MKFLSTIYKVAAHTDHVGPGTTFVAIKGLMGDGAHYITQAIDKGATTIVIGQDVVLPKLPHHIVVVRVDNPRKALAQLSAQAYGYPARALKILGVTGTKGKTTSVYLMRYLLEKAGYKVALLSTIENSIDDQVVRAHMTTAQPDYLHLFFAECVAQQIDYVIMEVAAQATTFDRLEEISFKGLIFTNLDREHAELYSQMEDYFQAKKAIFDHAREDGVLVVNGDDSYGQRLYTSYQKVHIIAADTQQATDFFVWQEGSIAFAQKKYVYGNLPGLFNAYNLAGVIVLLKNLSITLPTELGDFPAIPGRLEKITLANGAHAYIDYAHTPGSFKSLFSTVRAWTNHLIVVFGAGGGKDRAKRSLMGAIAQEYADLIILTDDNPRFDNPQEIIQDILVGITQKDKVVVEHDREKALHYAYNVSAKNSLILVLGKGPDEYQIIGSKKIPFSEKGILQKL